MSGLMLRFPKGFVWGAATSSYQIEGAWREGDRGLSVWDAFSHEPGRVRNGDTGDVACGHYHRFREDVALMAEMGLQAYRFSIAWPRIQPTGTGEPNPEGVRFYSELLDALLEHGIDPWVTLHHWDLPLALQEEVGGWLSPRVPELFAEYARICFDAFGDRVKHWITLNEPWVTAVLGYGQGVFAPGHVSREEPYQAGHEMLRAHARAVDVYRREFQPEQGGVIGIANNCDWREPLTPSPADHAAAQRAVEFFLGWFADPIYRGDYPAVMRERVGARLPGFTAEDRALLLGSSDFFGLNHYTTHFAADAGALPPDGPVEDAGVLLSTDPALPKTALGWSVAPHGCRALLEWVDERYDRPAIVLTENGCAYDDAVVSGAVNDAARIDFHRCYLTECHRAIEQGVELRGYFAWSFLDNFEWAQGYTARFGLHHVDFATGTRTPKRSAAWYRQVMERGGLGEVPVAGTVTPTSNS